MMIVLMIDYRERAIDLLEQKYPHKPMGKGHFRKGQAQIAHGLDAFIEPVKAADYKADLAFSAAYHAFDLVGKLLRRQHLALNAKGDLVRLLRYYRSELFVGRFDSFKLAKSAEALFVFVGRLAIEFIAKRANANYRYRYHYLFI